MSLIPCPYCGAMVADQDHGTCPKCGGEYEGWEIRNEMEAAMERRRRAKLTPSQKFKEDLKTGVLFVVLSLIGGAVVYVLIEYLS